MRLRGEVQHVRSRLERLEHRCTQFTCPTQSRFIQRRCAATQGEMVHDLYGRPLWAANHRGRAPVSHEFQRPGLCAGCQDRLHALALRCGCRCADHAGHWTNEGRISQRLCDVLRRFPAPGLCARCRHRKITVENDRRDTSARRPDRRAGAVQRIALCAHFVVGRDRRRRRFLWLLHGPRRIGCSQCQGWEVGMENLCDRARAAADS